MRLILCVPMFQPNQRSSTYLTGKPFGLCRRSMATGVKLVSEICGYLVADFVMTAETNIYVIKTGSSLAAQDAATR